MEYTIEEIQSKVNTLTSMLNAKKEHRKEIGAEIRDITKQIIHWEDFDTSQLKAF